MFLFILLLLLSAIVKIKQTLSDKFDQIFFLRHILII